MILQSDAYNTGPSRRIQFKFFEHVLCTNSYIYFSTHKLHLLLQLALLASFFFKKR